MLLLFWRCGVSEKHDVFIFSPVHPPRDILYMNTLWRVTAEWYLTGKARRTRRKAVPVPIRPHKSYMDRPGHKPEPPRWQGGDYRSETSQGVRAANPTLIINNAEFCRSRSIAIKNLWFNSFSNKDGKCDIWASHGGEYADRGLLDFDVVWFCKVVTKVSKERIASIFRVKRTSSYSETLVTSGMTVRSNNSEDHDRVSTFLNYLIRALILTWHTRAT
jgi:hypothetical protein